MSLSDPITELQSADAAFNSLKRITDCSASYFNGGVKQAGNLDGIIYEQQGWRRGSLSLSLSLFHFCLFILYSNFLAFATRGVVCVFGGGRVEEGVTSE